MSSQFSLHPPPMINICLNQDYCTLSTFHSKNMRFLKFRLKILRLWDPILVSRTRLRASGVQIPLRVFNVQIYFYNAQKFYFQTPKRTRRYQRFMSKIGRFWRKKSWYHGLFFDIKDFFWALLRAGFFSKKKNRDIKKKVLISCLG